MAVYSMTGYASLQHTPSPPATGPLLSLDVRAVNSRFLDLSFRMPDELRVHESALRELVGNKLKRGKVEVRMDLVHNATGASMVPPAALMQQLASAQDTVRTWLPETRPLSVADVLRWVSTRGSVAIDKAEVLQATSELLDALRDARAREGQRLADGMRDATAQLRRLATQAQPLVAERVAQQQQRYLERWNDALKLAGSNVPHDTANERALAEAAAFAIRIDVAEELTRLASHLDEIDRLLDKGGEVGKRLDFLIQELHREANTLGSKSAAIELTRVSVDMKVLIEQLREQVQNLE